MTSGSGSKVFKIPSTSVSFFLFHQIFPITHWTSLLLPDKKSDKCQTEFDSAYDQADNPYVLALKFFVQGTNYQDCKAKSFTFYGEIK